MTIGPDEAAELLKRNINGNRPVKTNKVHDYAKYMAEGRWIRNGEALRITESGTLLDGQHRLMAVIESGATVTFDVAVIPDDEAEQAFLTMDNGLRRSVSDFVEGENKNDRAAIARVMFCIENGDIGLASALQGKLTAMEQAPRVEVTMYANSNADRVGRYVRLARRLRGAVGKGSNRAYGSFLALVDYCGDGSMLDEFVDECCTHASASPTCMAFVSCLQKAYLTKGRPNQNWVVGTALDAYEHFCACDGTTMLNKAMGKFAKYGKLMEAKRKEVQQ